MSKLVLRFLKDNSGDAIETAIRYGLMAVGIALMIVAAVQLTGTPVKGTFQPHANIGRVLWVP